MQAHELFEILVRENADMLTAYLRSVIRDASAADDVFQETMLTAWRRLGDYDKTRPFGPWLRGIAARTMLAWRRQRARSFALCDEEILEHLGARCETIQSQPGDTWDQKLEGLRDCVDKLPDRYREVIQRRYAEEEPAESLAERLQITAETLKKRLQRGRARLMECLERKLRWTETPEGLRSVLEGN
ncbi:MAG: sigma-70 family RNA polymerase sigma factor [Planctomycetaceae bacterium]|nr:sigma-70 family RNA polymerase sigma factor [Planctomycetaceae bacterium]